MELYIIIALLLILGVVIYKYKRLYNAFCKDDTHNKMVQFLYKLSKDIDVDWDKADSIDGTLVEMDLKLKQLLYGVKYK